MSCSSSEREIKREELKRKKPNKKKVNNSLTFVGC